MIGFWTSAIRKIQENEQRRPRLRVRDRVPYVEIGVLLTAVSVSLSGVSTRKWVPVVLSIT